MKKEHSREAALLFAHITSRTELSDAIDLKDVVKFIYFSCFIIFIYYKIIKKTEVRMTMMTYFRNDALCLKCIATVLLSLSFPS